MNIKPNPVWKAPRIGAAQIKLLEKLSNLSGVSGNEDAVRKIVLEQVKDLADDIQFDAIGNILVTKRGAGRSLPRVMLAAGGSWASWRKASRTSKRTVSAWLRSMCLASVRSMRFSSLLTLKVKVSYRATRNPPQPVV